VKKSVDDPRARIGDPDAWSCLTNEQRDQIAEWYDRINEYHREDLKKERSVRSGACFFYAIPIAVYSVVKQADLIWWKAVLELAASWLFLAAIFHIIETGVDFAYRENHRVGFGLGLAVASLIILGRIFY
jgi:hypothetical protein